MLKYFCFFSIFCTHALLVSATGNPLALTREGALELAVGRNNELVSLRYEVDRARANSRDAGLMPSPEIGVSGASGHVFAGQSDYRWSASLSQKFPITGRLRMMRSLAVKEIDLALTEIRQAELEVKNKVSSLFDQLQSCAREKALIEEQIRLNELQLAHLQKQVERAEASALDAGHTQLVGATLRQQLHTIMRRQHALENKLRRLCVLDDTTRIALILPAKDFPLSLPEVDGAALLEHPLVLLKRQLAAIAGEQRDLALASRWEDVTVALFYEEDYSMDEPVGHDRSRMMGLSFSMPLPIRKRNLGEIESARIRERQMAFEVEATLRELAQKAAGLSQSYESINAQVASYQNEVLQLAEQRLATIESSYAAGQTAMREVFSAQENLLQLKLGLCEILTEQAAILTEWRYTTAQF